MKRKILAVLLGAVILFIWNAISWMALPFHSNSLNTIPEEVITCFEGSQMDESGVYHYPGLEAMDNLDKLLKGPRIPLMVFKKGGSNPFDPSLFATSMLFNLMLAFLVVLIVVRLADRSMKSTVSTSLILGLIVGFASDFPLMNWYLFPFGYTLINVIDHLVGLTIMGIVMDKLLKGVD